ncbi:MAG: DNA alkylation repair protein [Spirochaetes bacterium]|nr:DNA alkylation repair protein [Spirochaetota bacterium]
MEKQIHFLKQQIDSKALPEKADWWNRYLRNSVKFIGVGIPDIRTILLKWFHQRPLQSADYLFIADQLIANDIAEYKLAGILIYQLFLLKNIPNQTILDHCEKLFSRQLFYDWNTTDWLCVRVLRPMIDWGVQEDIDQIVSWHQHPYLWQARSSLVPFAQSKNLKLYYSNLTIPLIQIIEREERFAKTAVGWVLREVTKFDVPFVEGFLKTQSPYLTKEVINNALKYQSKSIKKEFIALIETK